MVFEPKIVIKPEFNIIGIKYTISHEEDRECHLANKAALDFRYNHKNRIKNSIEKNNHMAIIKYTSESADSDDYFPCSVVEDLCNIPEGMVGFTIPTNKYAVFKYIGFHNASDINENNLSGLCDYIFGVWLRHSDYNLADMYHFESLESRLLKEDYCEMNLYIPITRKVV
jgi:AraC family transcriptional regulator